MWIDVPNVKKKDGEHIVLCKKEQENVILVEVLTSSGTRNYGADGFVERKGLKRGGGREERQGWKMMELLSFNAHMNTRTHRKRAHDTVKKTKDIHKHNEYISALPIFLVVDVVEGIAQFVCIILEKGNVGCFNIYIYRHFM